MIPYYDDFPKSYPPSFHVHAGSEYSERCADCGRQTKFIREECGLAAASLEDLLLEGQYPLAHYEYCVWAADKRKTLLLLRVESQAQRPFVKPSPAQRALILE